MRHFFQIKIVILLFVSFSCTLQSNSDNDDITIKKYSLYSITDMDELDAAERYDWESSDPSVAVLRQGKYIFGLTEGKAVITVKDGNNSTFYNVSVVSDPDNTLTEYVLDSRALSGSKNNTYIGVCYDAFSGEEFNQLSVKNRKEIFDWEKVCSSGAFFQDDSFLYEHKTFSGTNQSSYMNSLSEKLSANVAVKFFGKKLYDKTWSRSNESFFSELGVSGISQVYMCFHYKRYYFVPTDGYYNYLLPEVQKDLLSITMHPSEFFEKYGTHVAVGTDFGQSFELDYKISNSSRNFFSDSNTNPKEYNETLFSKYSHIPEVKMNHQNWLKMVSDSLKLIAKNPLLGLFKTIFNFFRELKADSHTVEQLYQFWNTDCDNDGTLLIIGGYKNEKGGPFEDYDGFIQSHRCNDKKAIAGFDLFFHPFVFEPDYSRLIGPANDNSLIPVWELIPNTLKGKIRKSEFLLYIKWKKLVS